MTISGELGRLLNAQDGVIARRQVLDCGLARAFIRQRLNRRDWVQVHSGVYVAHTGPLTRRQKEWIAVLSVMPAALSHRSAIQAGTGATGNLHDPIHIVVDGGRRVTRPPGVVVHYSNYMAERVMASTHPPRTRLEHAVLDVAADATSELDAIAYLSDVVQSRHTTPDRLLNALASRSRIARRRFLRAVLIDIRDGTCSVLEHRYLTNVEQAHGLPRGTRQSPTEVGRPGFRDVEYDEWGLIVELDGRAHHDSARARDADLERDLDAFVFAGKDTIRLGYGQAVERACATAIKVGTALNHRGWRGFVKPCRSTQCAVRPPT
ncbi:MAG: hypothetical protein WBG47_11995 [Gordonia sp. (in: high G+C Gram-positive bacteria)]|uniref:hypothetical protein n=1 Tax=Gordonia sp. (in: high G+C Gram-positive bacteria) TaxID=84139 RepID=UPI003C73DC38